MDWQAVSEISEIPCSLVSIYLFKTLNKKIIEVSQARYRSKMIYMYEERGITARRDR